MHEMVGREARVNSARRYGWCAALDTDSSATTLTSSTCRASIEQGILEPNLELATPVARNLSAVSQRAILEGILEPNLELATPVARNLSAAIFSKKRAW
eukprot:CAMPEP_0205901048 /NCGR_PEP_ID=MMETSP1083-20121108/27469_1 /ASSEMBLY_ACC=CAM_ASM_000430 /TAXON_ID=97485 /ORGANISM="Prymnesium parvum, Strain Texoma1" /LENGTH=98 /DNA_ID=CAMNT_0053266541 /DNA_START=863 /DNA_END=1156 /DNA_ORIENTATION=+